LELRDSRFHPDFTICSKIKTLRARLELRDFGDFTNDDAGDVGDGNALDRDTGKNTGKVG